MVNCAFVSPLGLVRGPVSAGTSTSSTTLKLAVAARRVPARLQCALHSTKQERARLPAGWQAVPVSAVTTLTSWMTLGSAAWATDGTGEPLGIDDSRLLIVLLGVFITMLVLFISWSSKQDDGDDFVGEYDPRRR
jgi:hypothetical protein